MPDGLPGLYVHVPFCVHRCDYCDFAVTTGADDGARRRYTAALRTELGLVASSRDDWPAFGSVFVGGGTPTLLAPGDLGGVLRHIRDALPLSADAEITVEANPETVDTEGLAVLVDAGLTRLSLGAQSFDPGVLATLGRLHDVAATTAAVSAARRAGVAQVSMDLIYGTPGETDGQWRATLAAALALGIDHVSCYALTVEPNTPFAQRLRRGEVADVDDDTQADRMALADDVLSAAGLVRYEVSNWARPGRESRHNRNYWRGGDWLAAGASAHGHWQGRRWWNVRPTARYVERVEAGLSPVAGEEIVDDAQRRAERLLMGLRTVEGVRRTDVEPLDRQDCRRLVAAGLLREDGERLVLTSRGLAVAGGVAARLV